MLSGWISLNETSMYTAPSL